MVDLKRGDYLGVFIFLSILFHGVILVAKIPSNGKEGCQNIEVVFMGKKDVASVSRAKFRSFITPASKSEATSKPIKAHRIPKVNKNSKTEKVIKKERKLLTSKKEGLKTKRPTVIKRSALKRPSDDVTERNGTSSSVGFSAKSTGLLPKRGLHAGKGFSSSKGIKKTNLKANYFLLVKKIIEAHKFYPYNARVFGRQGKVVVVFSIDRKGVINNVKVVKGCRYRLLNRAALKTVFSSSPLPSPPSELKPPIWIKMELVFRLYGR